MTSIHTQYPDEEEAGAGAGAGDKHKAAEPARRGATTTRTLVRGQILLFALINAATLFIFVRKPFAWPNGEVARFMW